MEASLEGMESSAGYLDVILSRIGKFISCDYNHKLYLNPYTESKITDLETMKWKQTIIENKKTNKYNY